MTLTIVMITFNSADVMEGALKSVEGLWDELLVGDAGSTDGTVELVEKYGGKIIEQKNAGSRVKPGMTIPTLGERKQELVEKAKGDWILVLDADERVSPKLAQEIRRITNHHKIMTVAYRIPYQNYVFGKPVYWGGEKYAKVRLFQNGYAKISPEALHEDVIIDFLQKPGFRRSKPGFEHISDLRGVIHHHSYRTPRQLFTKFTRYAWTAAEMLIQKQKPGFRRSKPGFDTLFLYGPHMFVARFVKEKGYKDGWRGLVLALAFGYMEGLTYWLLLIRK
ncbi:MAG: glycosyltransferase family 2 protein [Candidatus Gottesmanbacteria bacterium]|nr:glycosyltransferase family 2 protein [Candidatus Gottesmanbacteria bacterium]